MHGFGVCGLGIALRRLSSTAENWEHKRPDALCGMFEQLKIGTEADNAAAVLAVAYLQHALETTRGELFMFEQWPLFVLASWSLALKHVYEASPPGPSTQCAFGTRLTAARVSYSLLPS